MISAIAPIPAGGVDAAAALQLSPAPAGPVPAAPVQTAPIEAAPVARTSFADMLTGGIDAVEAKVSTADAAARAFILDDSVPVHQVTYALEEARLSLELMMQVRGRLVEAYQQLMGMQL